MTSHQTNDGLENVVSGLGTSNSKREHNQFTPEMIAAAHFELENAYLSEWLPAKIVNIPADDSTREWRTLKCKDAEALAAAEKKYNLQSAVREARTWARLYGGAGIIPIIGNLSLEEPLDVRRIKRGSLDRFLVLDRRDLIPTAMNVTDILAENYNMPEYYTVRNGSTRIHWSWVARFNGLLLPSRQMQQTQGWGDSSLRRSLMAIKDMCSSVGGIAELMQEANVDILTREGLTDELMSDQDEAIKKRYQLFKMMKSNFQMGLLDGGETFQRQTLNLSGVAPVIEVLMTWISGAAEIPLTKLYGTSAKGMNATGEGDESNYYDTIRSQQVNDINPGLRLLDEVLMRTTLGDAVEDFDFEWNPLKQSNPAEIATARLADAQRHDINYMNGTATRAHIMKEYQAAEVYQYDDGEIEDASDYDD